MLREEVLAAIQADKEGNGIKITELEEILRAKNIPFGRDELRSEVWRLAAGERVFITAESRIIAK